MRRHGEDTERQLNAICPYYTMFPLSFPLSRLSAARSGDWVLDPFCGRGTTTFAARLLGLGTIGLDSNPVAACIAQAKLAEIAPARVVRCAEAILRSNDDAPIPRGRFWQLCFEEQTLRDLCKIRASLMQACSTPARIALRALVLGCLHGPRTKDLPSYFSNQMPRTYAAKPRYAVRYWTANRMRPVRVNVVELLRRKAPRYFENTPPTVPGYVECGDSREVAIRSKGRVAWVVTSPPYYGMRTYVPDQWLRNWFIGGQARVEYVFDKQITHHSPEHFAEQLALVWRNVGSACRGGARMIIRFGGISDRSTVTPSEILKQSIVDSKCGWSLVTSHSAGMASRGKRQAQQFGRSLDQGLEEHDFYAVLAQ